MSFIYKKYETERGFIKGLVVDVLYLKINDVTHNSPLPTIRLYPQSGSDNFNYCCEILVRNEDASS